MTIHCKRFNYNLIDYVGTFDQTRGVSRVTASPHVPVRVLREQPHLIDERKAAEYFAGEVLRIPAGRWSWDGSSILIQPGDDR